jgi:hypothetical protein
MKAKQTLVILIVVILAIIACLTAYTLVNSHEESLSTLRISNSCTVEAPISNNTVEHLDGKVIKFTFKSGDLTITHQKSGNNSEIKSLNTEQIKNSEKVEGNIYRDTSSGIYSTFIENNDTGDALLITSTNLDLLKRVSNSIKFKAPINMEVNDTNNTTEEIVDTYVEYDDSYEGYNYYEYNYPTTPAEPDSGSNDQKPENNTK